MLSGGTPLEVLQAEQPEQWHSRRGIGIVWIAEDLRQRQRHDEQVSSTRTHTVGHLPIPASGGVQMHGHLRGRLHGHLRGRAGGLYRADQFARLAARLGVVVADRLAGDLRRTAQEFVF